MNQLLRQRRHLPWLLLVLAAACAPRPVRPSVPQTPVTLTADFRPLTSDFDAGRGLPRLLVLASPS